MKALFILLFIISSSTFAEKAKFGLVTGLNLSVLSKLERFKPALGVDIGGAVLIKLQPRISLLTELTYTFYSSKGEVTGGIPSGVKAKVNLSHVEIKPRLLFHLNNLLSFSAGLNLGAPLPSEIKYTSPTITSSVDESINDRPIRFGANAGVNIHIKTGKMIMIPRIEYDFGLTEDSDIFENLKVSAFKLSLTTLF